MSVVSGVFGLRWIGGGSGLRGAEELQVLSLHGPSEKCLILQFLAGQIEGDFLGIVFDSESGVFFESEIGGVIARADVVEFLGKVADALGIFLVFVPSLRRGIPPGFGYVGALEVQHDAKLGFKVDDGFAVEEGFQNAVLDKGKNGFGVAGGVGLVADLDCFGNLPESLRRYCFRAAFGKPAAKRRGAGDEVEAHGTGLFEEINDGGVGVFGAEVEDEMLIFRREQVEFVLCFHV